MGERQEILHLWLAAAALDTDVKAWAHHDGTGEGDRGGRGGRFHGSEPPYRTGVDALRDGWFLLQAPGPFDAEATNGELPWEFVFERRHRVDE